MSRIPNYECAKNLFQLFSIRKYVLRRLVPPPPVSIANVRTADRISYDLPLSRGLLQNCKEIIIKNVGIDGRLVTRAAIVWPFAVRVLWIAPKECPVAGDVKMFGVENDLLL